MTDHLPTTVTVSVSSSLSRAISSPSQAVYTETGMDSREAPWTLPQRITMDLILDAQRAATAYGRLLVRAPDHLVNSWLNALGTLMAGQMTAGDAKVKIAAYAGLLDHPSLCYTQQTLAAAGRKFKWWPSFAELAEFLDDIAREPRRHATRINALANTSPRVPPEEQPRRYKDLSPEEQQAHNDFMTNWRKTRGGEARAIGKVFADMLKPPPRYVQNPDDARTAEDRQRALAHWQSP